MDPPEIDTVLTLLSEQQAVLSSYIDRRWSELDTSCLARLLSVHGQGAARLLRDRVAIHGPPPDPLHEAIDFALYDLGNELGINLIDPEDLEIYDRPKAPVDINDLIADLESKQARLARQLSGGTPLDDTHFPRLFNVYSLNASRLGRLLRLRPILSPQLPEEIERSLAEAYDDWLESQCDLTREKPQAEPEQDE